MTTLLYLAAGKFYGEYENLPYDRLIFVDKDVEFARHSYPVNNDRIIYMGKDALEAIDLLKQQKVKIDCLVSMDEGLREGGGGYPILSGYVMGYLSPLLKNQFTLVCDFTHYDLSLKTPMGKLDWGFKKVQTLKPVEMGYLDPGLFSYSQRENPDANFGHVFKMSRNRKVQPLFLPDLPFKAELVYGSIWDDENDLDLIGMNLLTRPISGNAAKNTQPPADFFRRQPKVYDLNGKSFEEILRYCNKYNVKNIGLCPWKQNDYSEVIDTLRSLEQSSLTHLRFYHLNTMDFRELYEVSRVKLSDRSPNASIR